MHYDSPIINLKWLASAWWMNNAWYYCLWCQCNYLIFLFCQPEKSEIKGIAAEGIITCLQDSIDSLGQDHVSLFHFLSWFRIICYMWETWPRKIVGNCPTNSGWLCVWLASITQLLKSFVFKGNADIQNSEIKVWRFSKYLFNQYYFLQSQTIQIIQNI